MGITYYNKEDLFHTAIKRILPADILLDIGTGIMPRDHINANVYICCEPFKQYVGELVKNSYRMSEQREHVVLNTDWESILKILPDKSVDTVMLVDVIEHLTKEEGERLLMDTARVARKQVVVFTPLGFLEQFLHPGGKDAWGFDGADWQEHKSGWLPNDFGSEWDLMICEKYHFEDNLGRPMEVPAGAFWAFKNLEEAGKPPKKVIVDSEYFTNIKAELLAVTDSRDRLQKQIDYVRSLTIVKIALGFRRMFNRVLGRI